MVDHSDDPKPIRRFEVISGAGGRRAWSEAQKAAMVIESLAPGAVVAAVARRHGVRAQQLHGWRRDAREGRIALPDDDPRVERLSFAPVLITAAPAYAEAARKPTIEIVGAGLTIRVWPGADADVAAALTRSLKDRT